jgi:hypothetical protein
MSPPSADDDRPDRRPFPTIAPDVLEKGQMPGACPGVHGRRVSGSRVEHDPFVVQAPIDGDA